MDNSAGYASRRIPYAEYEKLLESYRMQKEVPVTAEIPKQQTVQAPAPISPQAPRVQMPAQTPPQAPRVQAPVQTPPEAPRVQTPVQTPPEAPRVQMPVQTPPEAPRVQMPAQTPQQVPGVQVPIVNQNENELPQRGHSMDSAFCDEDESVIPIPMAQPKAVEVHAQANESEQKNQTEIVGRAEVTDSYPPYFLPPEGTPYYKDFSENSDVFLVEDLLHTSD